MGKLLGDSLDNFLGGGSAAVAASSAGVLDGLNGVLDGLLSGLSVVATARNGGSHQSHNC